MIGAALPACLVHLVEGLGGVCFDWAGPIRVSDVAFCIF
jgi:hypothetical protein